MKTIDIKKFVDRTPFRPFSVRLSNGAQYNFQNERDLGATKKCTTIIYFDPSDSLVLLDSANIVEIIDNAKP